MSTCVPTTLPPLVRWFVLAETGHERRRSQEIVLLAAYLILPNLKTDALGQFWTVQLSNIRHKSLTMLPVAVYFYYKKHIKAHLFIQLLLPPSASSPTSIRLDTGKSVLPPSTPLAAIIKSPASLTLFSLETYNLYFIASKLITVADSGWVDSLPLACTWTEEGWSLILSSGG